MRVSPILCSSSACFDAERPAPEGETYSATNMAGVLLVITGMGLVHVPAAAQPESAEELESFPTAEIEKGPRPIVAAEMEAISERLTSTPGDQTDTVKDR